MSTHYISDIETVDTQRRVQALLTTNEAQHFLVQKKPSLLSSFICSTPFWGRGLSRVHPWFLSWFVAPWSHSTPLLTVSLPLVQDLLLEEPSSSPFVFQHPWRNKGEECVAWGGQERDKARRKHRPRISTILLKHMHLY